MKRLALHWQILLALIISIPLGIYFGKDGVFDLTGLMGFLGSLFLNALKMIVVPLIVAAIITGISNIGSE